MFILMNFSFRTLCESSHRFWYAVFPFYFDSIYLLFSFWFLLDSLAGWSEMCCLFSLICEFSSFLLLLILSFILLWQEKTLYMFPVFLNLLRLVLWPIIWSIMELSLCVLEGKKKKKNCVFWSSWMEVFCRSVRFIWYKVWFKSNVSLLIFCLIDLSIIESVILNSPASIVVYFSFQIY